MDNDSFTFFSSLFPRDFLFLNDVFNSFNSFRNNVDLFCNSSSSGRLITSDHNYFNTSRSAFNNGFGYSYFRRINQRNQTNKSECINREVKLFRVGSEEVKTNREFSLGKVELGKTKNSFTLLAKIKINSVEFSGPFSGFRLLFTFNSNSLAIRPDFFRSTFHVNAVFTISSFFFYNS